MNQQMSNQGRMNQSQLMNWIMMLGFCRDDMELYLDTHPEDSDALDYFNQCLELLHKARISYEEDYGPLSTDTLEPQKTWKWVTTPMPWEGGRR